MAILHLTTRKGEKVWIFSQHIQTMVLSNFEGGAAIYFHRDDCISVKESPQEILAQIPPEGA